jgi:hypothetical protein
MLMRSVVVGLLACAAVPADAFGFSALHPIQVSVLAQRNRHRSPPVVWYCVHEPSCLRCTICERTEGKQP